VRDGDADLLGRLAQRSHHPQPVLSIFAATVALQNHLIPAGESDDVGAVLEAPDSSTRVGDWSREHPLDLGALGRGRRHARPARSYRGTVSANATI
jgi:hypothetical protein